MIDDKSGNASLIHAHKSIFTNRFKRINVIRFDMCHLYCAFALRKMLVDEGIRINSGGVTIKEKVDLVRNRHLGGHYAPEYLIMATVLLCTLLDMSLTEFA